jgi:hypothetical protein
MHVNRIAIEDIDILRGNGLGMRRCYGEQHDDRVKMDTRHAATSPVRWDVRAWRD